jgi:hypothetical protein
MWIIVFPRTMISICCHSPASPSCGLMAAIASPGSLPRRILQLPGSSIPFVPGAVMMLRPWPSCVPTSGRRNGREIADLADAQIGRGRRGRARGAACASGGRCVAAALTAARRRVPTSRGRTASPATARRWRSRDPSRHGFCHRRDVGGQELAHRIGERTAVRRMQQPAAVLDATVGAGG